MFHMLLAVRITVYRVVIETIESALVQSVCAVPCEGVR